MLVFINTKVLKQSIEINQSYHFKTQATAVIKTFRVLD